MQCITYIAFTYNPTLNRNGYLLKNNSNNKKLEEILRIYRTKYAFRAIFDIIYTMYVIVNFPLCL